MSREERERHVAELYEIAKSTLQRNSISPTVEIQDEVVAGLFRKGFAQRGPAACREAISDYCDRLKNDLHDWSSTRKDSGSIADGLAGQSIGVDSRDFDSGLDDPRRVNAIEGLRAFVTDRSYGRGELNFSAPVGTTQPGVGNFQFASGSELLDMAKPGNLDLLLVPADPASTFLKAKRVLETLESPWPADMGAPSKRAGK